MSTGSTHSSWQLSDPIRAKIDTILAEFTNATPGCAVAIYRGGNVVFSNGYGMSNLEHNVPITPTSIFHVASISKQFTAMCIALLHDDGLLNYNDPVHKYVPEMPTYDAPITIRHLIHHSSGIRDQWVLLRLAGWREDDIVTEDDCFDLIKRQQELNFPPNDKYMYSNSGYTLLAKIVKAASGLSLREFAQLRIFEPLGMTNTHFHDDHTEIVPGRTQAYQPRETGGYRISVPPFDVVGTTSLHTTVEDFAKWNDNFVSARICSSDVLRMVQTPGTFNDGKAMTYAWGLQIDDWRGQRRVGHDGSDHGYRSSYVRLPDLDFGITVFANLSTVLPAQIAAKIAETVLKDYLDEKPSNAGNGVDGLESDMIINVKPSALAGVYVADALEDDLQMHLIVQEQDDNAAITVWGSSTPLPKQEDDTFCFQNGFGKFWATEINDDGTVNKLCFQFVGAEPSQYTRVDTSRVDAPALADFAGEYYSPELDTQVRLDNNDHQEGLTWKQRKLEDRLAVRLDATTLGLGSLGATMRLEFEFDEAGNPKQFRLSNARLRNLRFVRQE